MRFVIGLIAIGLLAACGGGSNQNSAVVSQSPSSDQVTVRYLDLVRGFWSDYLDAENKGTEASAPVACIQEVDMKVCADRVKEIACQLQLRLTGCWDDGIVVVRGQKRMFDYGTGCYRSGAAAHSAAPGNRPRIF